MRSLSPCLFRHGERVGVRGSADASKILPLTLALSPQKSGERERRNSTLRENALGEAA